MKKFGRTALALGMAGIMAVSFAACAKTEETTQASATEATQVTEASQDTQATQDTQASDASQDTPAVADPNFVLINGFELKVGVKFDDVKDKLGKETAPCEMGENCDPEAPDNFNYYYGGARINVDDKGIVKGIGLESADTEAAFAGKVKVGSNISEVESLLGQPSQIENGSMYHFETANESYLMFTENGIISFISMGTKIAE